MPLLCFSPFLCSRANRLVGWATARCFCGGVSVCRAASGRTGRQKHHAYTTAMEGTNTNGDNYSGSGFGGKGGCMSIHFGWTVATNHTHLAQHVNGGPPRRRLVDIHIGVVHEPSYTLCLEICSVPCPHFTPPQIFYIIRVPVSLQVRNSTAGTFVPQQNHEWGQGLYLCYHYIYTDSVFYKRITLIYMTDPSTG